MHNIALCILLLLVFTSFKAALAEAKSVQQTLREEKLNLEGRLRIYEQMEAAGLTGSSVSALQLLHALEQEVCSINERECLEHPH